MKNSEHDFRDPVFVRKDDTTDIAASVVVWGDAIGGVSVRLVSGNESVLINAADWPAIKSTIDAELERAQ